MLYYLGLQEREARSSARFNYAEKAEYWALVWGTALMGLTGVMLWAKVWVGNLLARWWVDVATAVHFYEAILATLAIVVWHFYQVFFDPDVYPMNWAWWDGKMPVEHYRRRARPGHGSAGRQRCPILGVSGTPMVVLSLERARLQSCKHRLKTSRALQAAEKLAVLKGHGFSRAVRAAESIRLQRLRDVLLDFAAHSLFFRNLFSP